MIDLDYKAIQFIREHRVARLATADSSGQPQVVPICYVFEGGAIYSPIDEKPKRVSPYRLRRVRNVESNNRVSLVIDDYSDDWSRLAWLIVDGRAEIIEPERAEHALAVQWLQEKYQQYKLMSLGDRPMIKITPEHIASWKAQEG